MAAPVVSSRILDKTKLLQTVSHIFAADLAPNLPESQSGMSRVLWPRRQNVMDLNRRCTDPPAEPSATRTAHSLTYHWQIDPRKPRSNHRNPQAGMNGRGIDFPGVSRTSIGGRISQNHHEPAREFKCPFRPTITRISDVLQIRSSS
jgi:hypothetical protein